MDNAELLELVRRVDEVASIQAVTQLSSRYAMAVDARDLDTLVGLFVDDVDAGRFGSGPAALRTYFDTVLRGFYRSIHQVCGVVVDLVDGDHATGSTYCRAEHEDGDRWYVMMLRYDDTCERRDGRWCFVRRVIQPWYTTEILERPGPDFNRWPGHERAVATLPQAFPTWTPFWEAAAPPGH